MDRICVLLVEDDDLTRHLIERVLLKNGYNVVAAPTGAIASALLLDYEAEPVGAVLDMVLPGMAGVTYAEHLRRRFPHIGILFITGWLDLRVFEQAQTLAPVLQKPFEPGRLLAAVAEIIKPVTL